MRRGWLLLALTVACGDHRVFVCRADAECGDLATCEPAQACSAADPACPDTGRRYVDEAPADLAGECVACGGEGEPCCAGSCGPGRACLTGRCTEISTVAAGAHHGCLVRVDLSVSCFGDDSQGQLGMPLTGVAEVAPGGAHTCARLASGEARCWGRGAEGQLGDGQMTSSPMPVVVSDVGANVARITAGANHTCALLTDGSIYCWGANAAGQLGIAGDSNPRATPIAVAGLPTNVAELAAGGDHTCVRTMDGQVWCWGLGALPAQLAGLTAGAIAVGAEHACALVSGGGLSCWSTDVPFPTAVDLADVVQVAAGGGDTCAREIDDTVWCFGERYGAIPTPLPGRAVYIGVAVGDGYTCTLTPAALECTGSLSFAFP